MARRNMNKIILETKVRDGYDIAVSEYVSLIEKYELQGTHNIFDLINDVFIFGYA